MKGSIVVALTVLLSACCSTTQSPPALLAVVVGTRVAAEPELVSQVLAGERHDANAAWWGFDPEDATGALQAAIDSGARVVVVPEMGSPWNVRPITLRSDLELVLAEGTVVQAMKGHFHGKGDCLYSANGVSNLTIRGHGATLRMHKDDYQNDPYEKSEWRHAISLNNVRNVLIQGVLIESSGGDGIYIGGSHNRYCEDVRIESVVLADHHRQGISVISARNLLIVDTVVTGTRGTAPMAGIDFEPNTAAQILQNCVIRDSIFRDNSGAGAQVYLAQLDETSAPISITIDNCTIRGNMLAVWVTRASGDPSGFVRFKGGDIGHPRIVLRTGRIDVQFLDP